MHLLFICNVFHPDATATSQLFGGLLQRLVDSNVNITVYCGFPTEARGKQPKVARSEQWHGITIERCGWRLDQKRNLAYRGISYSTFLVHAFWRLIFGPRHDIIVGTTNPPFVGGLLWLSSRVRRFSYQLLLHDVYPEGVIALGSLRARGLVASGWRWWNRRAYRAAERIIVIGRDMIPLIAETYNIPAERFCYIPNWSVAETEDPPSFESSQMIKRLGLGDKFVVQYSGNMGLWHDMLGIVEAANRLRDDTRIHFLMIGDGRRRAVAEARSQELELPNMTWHDFVPVAQLSDSLAGCHVALISLAAGLEGVAVPSKLYGILASRRAMVAQVPAGSEIAMVVEEEDCGKVVPPGDDLSLSEAIRRMSCDPKMVDEMALRSFRAYRETYRLEHAVASFRDLWSVEKAMVVE